MLKHCNDVSTFVHSSFAIYYPSSLDPLRGVATGVYRYIYPKNQSTLTKFMWLFFSCDPGQIRYDICSRVGHVLKLQWLVRTYTPKSNSWLRPWILFLFALTRLCSSAVSGFVKRKRQLFRLGLSPSILLSLFLSVCLYMSMCTCVCVSH